MMDTLITSPNSVVDVINTGSGAGVFWNVASSATIDVNTTFLGNILALASISMNDFATDLCGRALADTGAVTLIQNSLSGTCDGIFADSGGLSGGLDVVTADDGSSQVVFLPSAPVVPDSPDASVPEPASLLLASFGLAGLFGVRKRHAAVRSTPTLRGDHV